MWFCCSCYRFGCCCCCYSLLDLYKARRWCCINRSCSPESDRFECICVHRYPYWKWFCERWSEQTLIKVYQLYYVLCVSAIHPPTSVEKEKERKKLWSSNQSTTTIHDPNSVRFHFKLKAWSDWANHKGNNSVHKSVADVEVKRKTKSARLGRVKCAKLKCGFDRNLSIFPVLILFQTFQRRQTKVNQMWVKQIKTHTDSLAVCVRQKRTVKRVKRNSG